MKTILAITTLALSASLTPAFATSDPAAPPPSGTVDRSQPTAYVKDSAITTKIKAKLAAEHVSSLANSRRHGCQWQGLSQRYRQEPGRHR